jgi:glycosyltransferase 2 family protein
MAYLSKESVARAVMLLCMFLGLGVTVWLLVASRANEVFAILAQIGWGAVLIVIVRATVVATNGVAWARLTTNLTTVPTIAFVFLRWIREAFNALLPVASVGGEVVAARGLTFWHVSGGLATASVVADLLLQVMAQAIFMLVGAALLTNIIELGKVLPGLLTGAALAIAALGGFYLFQRYGGGRLIDRALSFTRRKFPDHKIKVTEPAFQRGIDAVWSGRRKPVIAALLLHLLAWTSGTLEVLIAMQWMGRPVPLGDALVLESVGMGISSAAFFIPGSWGVQEAGYIFVGHLLGLPMQFALALSFAKRIPDFALGLPGLLAWYILEVKHALASRGAASVFVKRGK